MSYPLHLILLLLILSCSFRQRSHKMSLKDVLQSEKKVNHIKIKVISVHDENIIVADSSMQAICSSSNSGFKKMVEGQCYMIVKPIKQDTNFFVPKEKLQPIKIPCLSFQVKKSETNKLLALIPTNQSEKPLTSNNLTSKLPTFNDINQLTAKTEVKSITVKVISLSKEIQGLYGPYQIAKIKDITREKMDVNLYSKTIRNKLNRGDIIELKKLKVTEYKKEGNTVKRLATTARSTADKAKKDIEELFKDVPLGDEKEEGKVIAVHNIFPYQSCSKCWKKTFEEDISCQCENKEDIHVNDFHCQFCIQMKNESIIVVHTFRRQTDIIFDSQNNEEIQKALDDRYLERIFTFEWNNNLDDEDDLKMVNISNNHEQRNAI